MHRNRAKWAAFVFVLLLAGAGRGDAVQIVQDRITFNSAASNLTYIDFDNSVDMQRHPQSNPVAPDHSLVGSLTLLLAGILGLVLVRYRY